MIDLNNLVITVDQDVPVAPPKRKRGVDETNPQVIKIRAMKLGDSFFVPGEDKKGVRPVLDLGRKIGCTLVARDMPEGRDEIYPAEAGVRIWREETSRSAKALAQRAVMTGLDEDLDSLSGDTDPQAPVEEDDDEM